jgi:hypothetical protein
MLVMPGLVPGIYVLLVATKTWMAGTSPAMTKNVRVALSSPRNDERSYPRPTNGILLAITVMNNTLASSGRLAM